MPGQAATPAHPYDLLTPQRVLDTLDAVGLRGDGRLLQLNSYENRVFQVMLEDGSTVVAKFYRPARWRDAQILEEHRFARQLDEQEVPVIAPLALSRDINHAELTVVAMGEPATLGVAHAPDAEFRFAVYPCRSGHGPELDDPEVLQWLGRFVGRLHAVGMQAPFVERRTIDAAAFGHDRLAALLTLDALPIEQLDSYPTCCRAALAQVDAAFAQAGPLRVGRLHGDFHPGNILWRDEGPHVVDLDDCCNGPAIQDLWMLLSGSRESMRSQLTWLLEGYAQFASLDRREISLIEPLRTLRMIHHSAWLAERWSDPAFPAAFPWFGSPNYWQQQTQQLREQIEALSEPPLFSK